MLAKQPSEPFLIYLLPSALSKLWEDEPVAIRRYSQGLWAQLLSGVAPCLKIYC